MNQTTISREVARYIPALALERTLPGAVRKLFRTSALALTVVFGAFALPGAIGELVVLPPFIADSGAMMTLSAWDGVIRGLFMISTACFLTLLLFESFYNAYYFRGIEHVVHEHFTQRDESVTYEVARILENAENDLTSAFIQSPYGELVIRRAGVKGESASKYLLENRTLVAPESLVIKRGSYVTLRDLALHVVQNDPYFMQFLFREGVTEESYRGALDWVTRSLETAKYARRWWSRDSLGKIPGIGYDWSYGGAYGLAKYSRDLTKDLNVSALGEANAYIREKVQATEAILSRSKEANAVIVAESADAALDIVQFLGKEIAEGRALPAIAHKRIMIFDADAFIAAFGDKKAFEASLLKLLNEAVRAGNVIIVIPNFPSFVASARAIGSDAVNLMDPYLAGASIQVIIVADPESFHGVIERSSLLLERFEKIDLEGTDSAATVRVLADEAEKFERLGSAFFTFDALQAIAEAADRYITYGVMPQKAVDLLVELAPAAAANGKDTVTRDFVANYVQAKTGVPVGEVKDEERAKLLGLEEILHARVVGQDEAVNSIASTMRRARAGIQNPDRPMGSFLFFGPTGVGKTETAKALAAVFFGDEDKMLRLDMSEYAAADGIEKLIGSFDTGQAGILSNMLREHPYGVLLLDEFEKAADPVKLLFLQLLDEGRFSDQRGKHVNARNTIVIATSNAGSDMIFEHVKLGKSLEEAKPAIIDAIISKGILKPELLNRFDGVILFHPLREEHLRTISGLMLESLQKRIRERGYELIVNQPLVDLLVREGYNPTFGARPMRRAIQEVVEERLAKKILEGSLHKGSKIEFTEAELQSM